MSRLEAHKKDLYELRFSPMCKPAAEVANLTQLESHSTRARTMMMWRIVEGHLDWGEREVELLYESTLDSISEAFDVFHYPISQYMLDARADVWDAGLAPATVKNVVELNFNLPLSEPPHNSGNTDLLLALGGELVLIENSSMLAPLQNALKFIDGEAVAWQTSTGALAYTLGARDIARKQAIRVIEGIKSSGAKRIVADGPETAWAFNKVYPSLGVNLPGDVEVILLAEVLDSRRLKINGGLGKVFVHDSRAACLIADTMPSHLVVMPGYSESEEAFGSGAVYDAPRKLLDALGAERLFGTWSRGLAKSCGADDGLWLTHPDLAAGLARQRLDYARHLGADTIVTDSPLSVYWLNKNFGEDDVRVCWLPELFSLSDEESG
jgi:hypothetical protein